ncbi:zf-HC2 domain-containing protein [Corynebacterium choanae]|uniref:Putative zinc-finger domain-containing protein n=1 Tax=Corynebacterium choanae TaxID=1862358 RepID=A0A3G6J575_9CORY|nr:zf-HC2 domain-containing protein [Corynebacterium choanae]AZA13116.1 hypothetical protein CCHOA_03525 [Corynebacterium choanae]
MIDCDAVQVALSARLDGEPYQPHDDVLDAHVSGCAACREFLDQAAHFKRLLALQQWQQHHTDQSPARAGETLGAGAGEQAAFSPITPAAMYPAPDLSQAILAGVDEVARARASRATLWLALGRIGLLIIGCICVTWAVLILGSTVHTVEGIEVVDPARVDATTRGQLAASLLVDAAAVRLAMACGCWFTAWRPSLAFGVLTVVAPLTAFSFGFTTRDVVLGFAGSQDVAGLLLLLCTTILLGLVGMYANSGHGVWRRWWRAANAQPE